MFLQKLLLSLAILPIVWLAFEVSEARDVRKRVLEASDARTDVECENERRSKGDCILSVLSKGQVSRLTYVLLNVDESDQWIVLYTIAGLGGAIVSFWILFWQGSSPGALSWDKVLWRVLLGGTSGLLSYLVVKLPSGIWGGSKLNVPGASTAASQYALYNSLELLPAIAGIFIGVFFEGMEGFLRRLLKIKGDGG